MNTMHRVSQQKAAKSRMLLADQHKARENKCFSGFEAANDPATVRKLPRTNGERFDLQF